MSMSFVVLAAGQGSRMMSGIPKVLHKVAASPLLHHAMATAAALIPDRMVVVVGHGGDAVAQAARDFDPQVRIARQDLQLGTAHAVAQALPHLAGAAGDAIVLYGDTPFIQPETLAAMQAARRHHAVVVLGFTAADPGRYGRLVATGDSLDRIVEYKDATDPERAITLCNSGVICADAALLAELLAAVGSDNAAGEYYLTDIVGIARARGLSAGVVTCDEAEALGINTRVQLAEAEQAFQARARSAALANGVTMTAPETVFLARDTVLGRDVVIGPHVLFGPGVTIDAGAEIHGFCHLEGCHVAGGAGVGPFARLRPGTALETGVHVGNFVEIKNSTLARGVKVGHLTYLGDADVGAASNIGAGTVTCNYDGVMKHRTIICSGAFVGSGTMLVAPVTVGDAALTAAGSVITEDVPAGAIAIARARQTNKPGLATRLFDRLRAIRAQNTKGR